MKVKIIFLGKTKENFISAGINDYLKRLRRYANVEVKTIKEKRGRYSEKIKIVEEGKQLLKSAGQKGLLVALDPKGKEFSSENLANLIDKWELHSRNEVTFLIGGPLGISEMVKEKADVVLSLSKMTFTHEMARLLLIEQLYRAYSIKAGSKYHK